jgi:alpha-L-glutamate ligase-like protein
VAQFRWRFWAWPWELRRTGILGMNRRNASYILPHNARKHFARVDDKLLTKQICERHGIPVPRTYAVIERQGDVRRVAEIVGEREEFVVKPTQGSGGRGILVIARRTADGWITSGDQQIPTADMHYHLSAILAGLYSLGGRPDRAVIEERIRRHEALAEVAVGGTPDIRVVLYRNVPAMAMVRLPTEASRGRANLHQGAAAAGIDLRSGRTTGGVCNSRAIDVHPDTHAPITGLAIPYWRELLTAAVRLSKQLELGYVGIDFVLDESRGPIVLEANARPGLAIQIANRQGLLHRLHAIDAHLAAFDPAVVHEETPAHELGLVARIIG